MLVILPIRAIKLNMKDLQLKGIGREFNFGKKRLEFVWNVIQKYELNNCDFLVLPVLTCISLTPCSFRNFENSI